jgi:hypothetical protein
MRGIMKDNMNLVEKGVTTPLPGRGKKKKKKGRKKTSYLVLNKDIVRGVALEMIDGRNCKCMNANLGRQPLVYGVTTKIGGNY